MSTADVAVVIPVYNRAHTILDTLASIAAQTVSPRRLIVVDDGSSDRTPESVEDYLANLATNFQSLLLRQPTRGASAARNAGLRVASDCQFIAFLDSDDLWPGDFIARCSAALQANSAAVAVSCDRLIVDSNLKAVRHDDLKFLSDDATKWLFCNDGGIGSASLFSTRAIEQLGGYNERLPTGHDSELFFRLSLSGRWLHAPGSPTRFQCGRPRVSGEHSHLCEAFSDCHRRWAQIFEDFILEQGGNRVLDPTVYQAVLAKRWLYATHQLIRAGRVSEARDCLHRSRQWGLWNPKLWLRWTQTYLRSA